MALGQYIQETQNGPVAYIHGIANNGTPFTIDAFPSFIAVSDELTLEWNEKRKMDSAGSTRAIIATDAKIVRNVKLEITGATRAAAVANALFPAVLASVNFANMAVAAENGAWRLLTGTKMALQFDDELSVTLPLEKMLNADQNTALNTTIVG